MVTPFENLTRIEILMFFYFDDFVSELELSRFQPDDPDLP